MKTVLAPLHLHGVGTPAVESLASFFCRLADVHQVSPRQLSKVVCNDSAYLQFGGPQLRNVDLYAAMFCSYAAQTEVLVQRLEKLTGAQNLVCGTLLRLRHVLGANQVGACVRKRRWCPACYARCEGMIVEPLAWSILVARRCPIHGIRLQDQCSRCGSYQYDWRFGPERKICRECGSRLGEANSGELAPTPWEIWSHEQMLRLLGYIASPDSPEVIPNALPTFITRVTELVPPDRARKRPAGWGTAWERSQRHRLSSIFAMAAHWGTTPLKILLCPEEAATPSLFQGEVDLPAAPIQRHFNKDGYRRCERTLQRLLRLPAATPLPALLSICRECVVSSSNFKSKNWELCKRYTAERRRRMESAKARRFDVANGYATRLLRDLFTSGSRLHRKHAVIAMMRDVHVSKAVARSALRVALARMSANREPRPSKKIGKAVLREHVTTQDGLPRSDSG